jgi:hypothetical protein
MKVEGCEMKTVLSIVAAVTLGVASASGQAPPRIDVTKLGPQVGDRIPDFNLPDQKGISWTRDALMGPRGLMLVFQRSADW